MTSQEIKMKRFMAVSALLFSWLVFANSAYATGFAHVTNGNNDGPGSLRAALVSGASTVKISRSVSSIVIDQPLSYSASSRLRIIGSKQIIDGSALSENDHILSITQSNNVSISDLAFVGSSSQVNFDSLNPLSGKGIFLSVPIEQTGLVRVFLRNVSVSRVANHGVHISDCSLGDDCGSGSGGEGSPASIYVNLDNVTINKVGFGKADADGVRVDDRGDGSIYFSARRSTFINVGADGVELDEGNNGNVIADVGDSLFDSNGEYCSLIPFVTGSPCDDDGDADVDDGFDIDEAGAGSLYARIRNSKVTNNFDEGLDFDEEDGNGIEVELINVFASGNADEGIKMSEEGEGSLQASLRRVTAIDNNGRKEGIELEEENAGDVRVFVRGSSLIGGEDEAFKVEQADEGEGKLQIRNSNIGVLDLDGVAEI